MNVLDPSKFPPWSDTPLWVKYRAIDKDGSMWWFEDKPIPVSCEWLIDLASGASLKMEYIGYTTKDIHDSWMNTLEERP